MAKRRPQIKGRVQCLGTAWVNVVLSRSGSKRRRRKSTAVRPSPSFFGVQIMRPIYQRLFRTLIKQAFRPWTHAGFGIKDAWQLRCGNDSLSVFFVTRSVILREDYYTDTEIKTTGVELLMTADDFEIFRRTLEPNVSPDD